MIRSDGKFVTQSALAHNIAFFISAFFAVYTSKVYFNSYEIGVVITCLFIGIQAQSERADAYLDSKDMAIRVDYWFNHLREMGFVYLVMRKEANDFDHAFEKSTLATRDDLIKYSQEAKIKESLSDIGIFGYLLPFLCYIPTLIVCSLALYLPKVVI